MNTKLLNHETLLSKFFQPYLLLHSQVKPLNLYPIDYGII